MAEGRSRVYLVNIKQRSILECGSDYSKMRTAAEHSLCGNQTMGRSAEPSAGVLLRGVIDGVVSTGT